MVVDSESETSLKKKNKYNNNSSNNNSNNNHMTSKDAIRPAASVVS